MYAHDKRHASGTLLPNFYFLLQLIAIALLTYIFLEIAPLLNISNIILYLMALVVLGVVFYCEVKREIVIRRQRFR